MILSALRKRLDLIIIIAFLLFNLYGVELKAQSRPEEYDPVLVSNVFFESDLRQALRDLSDEAGIPIIPDNTVQGLVSLEFENAPLENVLRKILASGGYTFRKIDDYYLVGAATPENPSFPLLTETEIYHPGYLEVDQIPALLSDYYQNFVRVHLKSNTLSITASPEILNQIKDRIKVIDEPPRQISIEAIVTELTDDVKKSLGLDWSILNENETKRTRIGTNMNSMLTDSSIVGSLFKSGLKYSSFKYDLILNLKALANDGKAKIKANPKITTIDGEEAKIFIGSEQYFSIVTGPVNYPYTRLEQIPAGITLQIRPRLSRNNEITATVNCEVSEVTEIGTSGLPLVTKRTASTKIRVKDNEIIAIGGLVQEKTISSQKKIPFLGDIPVLGYVFSHTKREKVQTEIAIFIAPHLVTDAYFMDADCKSEL